MSSTVVIVSSALGLAFAACGTDDRAPRKQGSSTMVPSRALADLAIPDGWTASYDKDADAWQIVSNYTPTMVRIERADERYVASPDAYMHHLAPKWGTTKLVTIEDRQHVNGGFAMTLAVFASKDDPKPMRATYVVRQLRKVWYRCYAEGVDDDSLRAQVIELCRSVHVSR
jgi:hypothetical protein